ncbi:putative deacetylase [metagenome]|uniref:Putative deacetylase n=1 Tax=metagenome TaxID=256318 RepID=A0A2P2C8Y4_9ZZZZ
MTDAVSNRRSTLVISAHAGDFVWYSGGAIALAASRGEQVTIACLAIGEHGEAGRAWREGKSLETIREIRRDEALRAAGVLGADVRFLPGEDYPLVATRELVHSLVELFAEVRPTSVLTHTLEDPYNVDHPVATRIALEARELAVRAGHQEGRWDMGPQVFFFEPNHAEMSGFLPQVYLDISEVFDVKRKAMETLPAKYQWEYHTELARLRGAQLRRNAGANLTEPATVYAEAFMRYFPQVVTTLE